MTHWHFIALAYSVSFFVLALLCLFLGFGYRRRQTQLKILEARLAAADKANRK